MNKYHIGNLHIESGEQLNGTGLLLGKSSKIAPDRKRVESAYFIVSGQELTPLPGGIPEIIYARGTEKWSNRVEVAPLIMKAALSSLFLSPALTNGQNR